MKNVWGVVVAVTALFLVWLWATGRFAAVWQGIVTGKAGTVAQTPTTSSPAPSTFSPYSIANDTTGLSGYPSLLASAQNEIPTFSITPNISGLESAGSPVSFTIPQYISTGIGKTGATATFNLQNLLSGFLASQNPAGSGTFVVGNNSSLGQNVIPNPANDAYNVTPTNPNPPATLVG